MRRGLVLQVELLPRLGGDVLPAGWLAPEPVDGVLLVVEVVGEAQLLGHGLHLLLLALVVSGGGAPLVHVHSGLASDLALHAVLVAASLPGPLDLGLDLLDALLLGLLLPAASRVHGFLTVGVLLLVPLWAASSFASERDLFGTRHSLRGLLLKALTLIHDHLILLGARCLRSGGQLAQQALLLSEQVLDHGRELLHLLPSLLWTLLLEQGGLAGVLRLRSLNSGHDALLMH